MYSSRLLTLLDIEVPVILAPMYLVTNEQMIVEACNYGATGAIPAMNWATPELMRTGIRTIKEKTSKPFGINIISHKSNASLEAQLSVCIEEKVAFIITSLGNPEYVIQRCKPHGIKVFCDVVDTRHVVRLEKAGADALIAVSKFAGGHAGQFSHEELIPAIKSLISIPVIAAGGITNATKVADVLSLGAEGVSCGTIFIATHECNVSSDYKNALIQYRASDIVLTDKLSGVPFSVINTPYVQKIGTRQNRLERWLNNHKQIKRWVKQFAFSRGMRILRKAAFSATYQTVWCAGHSIEDIHEIVSVKERLDTLSKGLSVKKI